MKLICLIPGGISGNGCRGTYCDRAIETSSEMISASQNAGCRGTYCDRAIETAFYQLEREDMKAVAEELIAIEQLKLPCSSVSVHETMAVAEELIAIEQLKPVLLAQGDVGQAQLQRNLLRSSN